MGLFEKIFKRPQPSGNPESFFKTLTTYTPTFSSWSGALYESELVRAAIHARATHISKLRMTVQGTANPILRTKLKIGPCDWMTTGQFLYRLSTILDVATSAFIVPILNEIDEITGFFPVLPSRCELIQYNAEPWIRYTFQNGEHASMELQRCGILTKFQYRDDFFGAGNEALSSTMELINIQNQGIAEAVKNAATYRFMARVNNFSNSKDLAKERKRFSAENFESEGGGVLLFPISYSDIQQVKSTPFVIDADQMRAIHTNVYNYFGVNEDILQNRAVGDSWSAFYEGAVEPFAIQCSEVLSKMSFSQKERDAGAGIMLTANRLQYMTNQDKLNVSAQMADRGIMNRDEIREIWNLPALPNGEGQAYTIRGEYYLLGADGNKKGDEQKVDQ